MFYFTSELKYHTDLFQQHIEEKIGKQKQTYLGK